MLSLDPIDHSLSEFQVFFSVSLQLNLLQAATPTPSDFESTSHGDGYFCRSSTKETETSLTESSEFIFYPSSPIPCFAKRPTSECYEGLDSDDEIHEHNTTNENIENNEHQETYESDEEEEAPRHRKHHSDSLSSSSSPNPVITYTDRSTYPDLKEFGVSSLLHIVLVLMPHR